MSLVASQPFPTLDQLVRSLRVVLPKPREEWRLVRDPLVGQITGLPNFRGATLATNGIMVLLRNEVDRVYIGHLGWFVPDADELAAELSDLYDNAQVAIPRTKRIAALRDYYAL
jgi:hypothetical protein